MTSYWCVNFDSKDCLLHGIKRNLWMMQYQYADDRGNDFQDHKKGMIAANWRQLGKVRPGNLLVAYLPPSRFFAVGRVIAPRRPRTDLDVDGNIEGYLHDMKSHRHKQKCVFYTDAFYEDFTDKWRHPGFKSRRYPQRIDIDVWKLFVADGVYEKGLQRHMAKNPHLAITRIDKMFYKRIEDRLLVS